jgi:hypothetical protein
MLTIQHQQMPTPKVKIEAVSPIRELPWLNRAIFKVHAAAESLRCCEKILVTL